MIHGAYLDRDWYAEQILHIKDNFKFEFEPCKTGLFTDQLRQKLRRERIKNILENNIKRFTTYAFYDETEHFDAYNTIRIGLPYLITTLSFPDEKIYNELELAQSGFRNRWRYKPKNRREEVLFKDFSVGYANRGSHYLLLKKYKEAIVEYKYSLKIDKDYELANRYLKIAEKMLASLSNKN